MFEKSVENHFFDCMLSAQEIRTLIDELGDNKGLCDAFFFNETSMQQIHVLPKRSKVLLSRFCKSYHRQQHLEFRVKRT